MPREYLNAHYKITFLVLHEGKLAIEGGQLPCVKCEPPAQSAHQVIEAWIQAREVKAKDVRILLYKNIPQGKNLKMECVVFVNVLDDKAKGLEWVNASLVNLPVIIDYLGRIKQGKTYPLSLVSMEADPIQF